MASKSDPGSEYICGGQTKVFYVYRRNRLEYSKISHENKQFLQGFPKEGHFIVKVTKAIIRTSNPIEAYNRPGDCEVQINRKSGGPRLTDKGIDTMVRECETTTEEKETQMKAGETRPILVEKLKTKDIYAKHWCPEEKILCTYKKHSPELLTKDLVLENRDFEKECKTANVVEFSPPMLLFYGRRYNYHSGFKTRHRSLLEIEPRVVLVFYGRLCETTNKTLTANGARFFSAWKPRLYKGVQTGANAEHEPREYESDIDDWFEDSSTDAFKHEASKETATKTNSGYEKSEDELTHEVSKEKTVAPNSGSEKPEDEQKEEASKVEAAKLTNGSEQN